MLPASLKGIQEFALKLSHELTLAACGGGSVGVKIVSRPH
jgi:hypothetical protein